MNARKCDRCGKYYDEYNQNSKSNGICFCRNFFTNNLTVAHDLCIDLCPDCMNDVKAFLETDTKTFVAAFNKAQISN